MRITITGRNIELTEGLKAAVEEKLSKLEKFFAPDTNVFVTLSVEKERQKIEVTIPIKGHVIRSEQSSNDMYVSIDLVEEVIERQLRKYRTKLASKKMNVAENFSEAFIDSDADEDEEIKIVRTKRFGMKPMYADGTDRTRFLRIPQCRDRRGQCRIQEKRKYIWSDRAGVLVHRNRRASIGCPFFV